MNMQKQVYDTGARWDQFVNDTAVDYSLQVEAWWKGLRERAGRRMGAKAVDNVVKGNFPQQDVASEMPALEVGQGS